MFTLSLINFIFFIVSFILGALALVTGKKSSSDREKLSPFECGFDPLKKARVPFSLRFFLVTIIFLIFDVEIVLLLPLGVIFISTGLISLLVVSLIIIIILFLGLINEWNQGALDWLY